MTTTDIHTAEQLLNMPDDGMQRELVRGELKTMAPAGGEHGEVESNLIVTLGGYVKAGKLGRVYPGDAGFILARDPDTVRSPDVAFVRQDRVPQHRRGFLELCPDLVAEVVSPNDRHSEVLERVDAWLAAGAKLVWVISPPRREVMVYAPDARPAILTVDDELTAGDVVPGFRVKVSSLFE